MNSTEKQEPLMCHGAFLFLQKEGQPNIMMKLAYSMGIDSPLQGCTDD